MVTIAQCLPQKLSRKSRFDRVDSLYSGCQQISGARYTNPVSRNLARRFASSWELVFQSLLFFSQQARDFSSECQQLCRVLFLFRLAWHHDVAPRFSAAWPCDSRGIMREIKIETDNRASVTPSEGSVGEHRRRRPIPRQYVHSSWEGPVLPELRLTARLLRCDIFPLGERPRLEYSIARLFHVYREGRREERLSRSVA